VKVIIPAACYKAEQLDAATFVFKTIRVGFPTAEIVLVIGNTAPELREAIIDEAKRCGLDPTCNDDFATRPLFDVYESFLNSEKGPFFYCDTDIIFWESIESRFKEFARVSMAGRFIPKFYDKASRCITMPRVHNCLLYVDPYRLQREVQEYYSVLPPDSYFTPRPDLVRPTFVSIREEQGAYVARKNYFYDTWAMAYNALPGVGRFSEELDACFDHLNCGSIAHLIGPAYGVDLAARHRFSMKNPESLRGIWRVQRGRYEAARVD
jgi:hypothetical protein